jgi:uncharacterized protein YbjT (DUF2867 family)
MILVTGGAGKTGRAVIRALAPSGAPVTALVRNEGHAAALQAAGVQAVHVGDMRVLADLQRAAAGVTVIYHICPNMHPDEEAIASKLIAVAEASGVARIVYHSVLHPQTEEMPHHWAKLRVEEQLFRSRLAWTILQPAAYMQNLLAYRAEVAATGRYRVPYPADTLLGMVDLEDVAAVAARVLIEDEHNGAIYELSGAQILTQHEVAAAFASVLGRPVVAEQIPLDVWEANARSAGLSDYAVTTLRKMFEYYGRYGFWGNPAVLTMLLRRPPATLQQCLSRTAQTQ